MSNFVKQLKETQMINAMLQTTLTINEPMTNIFTPGQSVLPERLRSISMPNFYPILSDDLNSVTEPLLIKEINETDTPTENKESSPAGNKGLSASGADE